MMLVRLLAVAVLLCVTIGQSEALPVANDGVQSTQRRLFTSSDGSSSDTSSDASSSSDSSSDSSSEASSSDSSSSDSSSSTDSSGSLAVGADCSEDGDCASGKCHSKLIGQDTCECESDSDCDGGTCDTGGVEENTCTSGSSSGDASSSSDSSSSTDSSSSDSSTDSTSSSDSSSNDSSSNDSSGPGSSGSLAVGADCSEDGDCASGKCHSKLIGQDTCECSSDSDCDGGTCDTNGVEENTCTGDSGSNEGFNPSASAGELGAQCTSDDQCKSDSCADSIFGSDHSCQCKTDDQCPGTTCCDVHSAGTANGCTADTTSCTGLVEDIAHAANDVQALFKKACKYLGDIEKGISQVKTCLEAFTSGGSDIAADVNCACDAVEDIDTVAKESTSTFGKAVSETCGMVSEVTSLVSDAKSGAASSMASQFEGCVKGDSSCASNIAAYAKKKFFNC